MIIVGAGSAGMMCAIAAAEKGTKVIVIEKTNEVGGTLHLTAGHMSGAGTLRQQEKGIADSPEAHYADVMRINASTGDKALIKLATQLNPQLIDWLQAQGFPFDSRTPAIIYGHVPYQTPRTHWGALDYGGAEIKWAGTTIYLVIKPLWDKYLAAGLINLRLSHKMLSLIHEDKQIKGVKVLAKGKEQTILDDCVVLTTGGYAANPQLFLQLTPNAQRLISTARESSTGDGLLAAMVVGGQLRNTDAHQITLGGIELEPNSGRTNFWQYWARISNSVDRKPRELYVNAEGKRFMNEAQESPDVREKIIIKQPKWQCWVIFDENALHDGDCIVPQWSPEQLKTEAQLGRAVWTAHTIGELAARTKLPQAQLEASVQQYNQAVEAQYDELFGRTYLHHAITKPPFYALLTYGFSLVSFGGIAVNDRLQVIDNEGSVIKGLYAAGEILGAGATSGHAFCGGMILTPALAFGRYLGQNL